MYVLDVIFVSLLVKDYQSNVTTALKVIDFENKNKLCKNFHNLIFKIANFENTI
ncbi:MAG: hypothetical protein ACLRQF_15670 [Thomasclavelia ramosa]